MIKYPSIDHWKKGLFGNECIAFYKYDGSNIRAEWNKKNGWNKFGTRNRLLDNSEDILGESIDIFLNKYADDLEKIFISHKEFKNKNLKFTAFFEFFGQNSFAGNHDENDKKDVILFDIHQYKKGFIFPNDFIKIFGHLDIPKIIYTGNYNKLLIDGVKDNKMGILLDEGVIVKGKIKTKKSNSLWMTKIKTNSWLKRLKESNAKIENDDLSLIGEI